MSSEIKEVLLSGNSQDLEQIEKLNQTAKQLSSNEPFSREIKRSVLAEIERLKNNVAIRNRCLQECE